MPRRLTESLKVPARRLLESVPVALWRRISPQDALVLNYHMVSDRDVSHVKHYPYKNAARFEADVAYAREHHGFISYRQLADGRRRDDPLPGNRVLFTFDDGFAECLAVALPILQAHGAEAVFFVTTDFIDNQTLFYESVISLLIGAVERLAGTEIEGVARQLEAGGDLPGVDRRGELEPGISRLRRGRIPPPETAAHRDLILWLLNLDQSHQELIDRFCDVLAVTPSRYLDEHSPYLTRSQIRQIAAQGFTIGAHSTKHQNYERMSPAEVEEDVLSSCDVVCQLTGESSVPFAFPYGGLKLARPWLAELVRRHPRIEIFFDTGGLWQEVAFVVHRLGADSPAGCVAGGTNLPRLLRRAWSKRTAWYGRSGRASRR